MTAAGSPSSAGEGSCFRLHAIVVGCRKCGTTWLNTQLGAHPKICTPGLVKETHFHGRYFERGLSWYEGFFSHRGEGQQCVEVDPELVRWPEAARRLADTWPGLRILAVFREPVRQFWSSYRHAVLKRDTVLSPRQAWEQQQVFRDELRYATLIEPFLQRFEDARIKLLVFEDLQQDPGGFLDEVLAFLGLATTFESQQLSGPRNAAREPRWSFVSPRVFRLARWLREHDFHRPVNLAKRLGIRQLVTREPQGGDALRLAPEP